jgi:hypothetical protein
MPDNEVNMIWIRVKQNIPRKGDKSSPSYVVWPLEAADSFFILHHLVDTALHKVVEVVGLIFICDRSMSCLKHGKLHDPTNIARIPMHCTMHKYISDRIRTVKHTAWLQEEVLRAYQSCNRTNARC